MTQYRILQRVDKDTLREIGSVPSRSGPAAMAGWLDEHHEAFVEGKATLIAIPEFNWTEETYEGGFHIRRVSARPRPEMTEEDIIAASQADLGEQPPPPPQTQEEVDAASVEVDGHVVLTAGQEELLAALDETIHVEQSDLDELIAAEAQDAIDTPTEEATT